MIFQGGPGRSGKEYFAAIRYVRAHFVTTAASAAAVTLMSSLYLSKWPLVKHKRKRSAHDCEQSAFAYANAPLCARPFNRGPRDGVQFLVMLLVFVLDFAAPLTFMLVSRAIRKCSRSVGRVLAAHALMSGSLPEVDSRSNAATSFS